MVVLSDISGQIVPDGEQVKMVIEHHPVLGDEQVELDASMAEVAPMLESGGQYIVIKFHMPDGEIKNNVVEISTFDAAFKGDPYQVLKEATRVVVRGGGSTLAKRDPSELQAVRDWCRANGWPDLKDKGRVPIEAQAAYDKANPQDA